MSTTQNVEALFLSAMKQDEDAVAFLMVLFSIFHTWDDLEDRDKFVGRQGLDEMMFMALVVLPRNAFYQRNFQALSPLVETAIYNWHVANQMERDGSDEDKHIAFIIRSDYCNIAIKCAAIVGGYSWALEVSPELRRHWHREGFDGYLSNLAAQFENEKEIGHVL